MLKRIKFLLALGTSLLFLTACSESYKDITVLVTKGGKAVENATVSIDSKGSTNNMDLEAYYPLNNSNNSAYDTKEFTRCEEKTNAEGKVVCTLLQEQENAKFAAYSITATYTDKDSNEFASKPILINLYDVEDELEVKLIAK